MNIVNETINYIYAGINYIEHIGKYAVILLIVAIAEVTKS